jgi:hypothetical protein
MESDVPHNAAYRGGLCLRRSVPRAVEPYDIIVLLELLVPTSRGVAAR